MNLQNFTKTFPKCEDPQTVFAILDRYEKEKAFSLNHRQKMAIQDLHVFIGHGKLNLACGSCIGRGMNKIIQYLNNYVGDVDYTTTPKVTKKTVKTKVKAQTKSDPIKEVIKKASASIDQYVKDGETDFKAMHFSTLKSVAEKRLQKKYPKGTKKTDILKDLGVE